MIEFCRAFKVGTGDNAKTFSTLKEAQREGLKTLVTKFDATFPDNDAVRASIEIVLNMILSNTDAVIDILTTTATSRPKGRSVNGGKKPRKAKVAPVVAAS